MAFPTTSLLDAFTRANSANLGANWTNQPYYFDDNWTIVSNQAGTTAATGWNRSGGYWSASTFGADIEAYLTVAALPPAFKKIQVLGRIQSPGTSGNGYCLDLFLNNTQWEYRIYRIDAGSLTQLGSTVNGTLTAGDTLGISVVGTAITGYQKTGGTWSTILSQTDATYSGVGYIGMWSDGTTTKTDDFRGGTVVTGGGGPTILLLNTIPNNLVRM